MILSIAIASFAIAGCCAGVRLLLGPSLADRVAALDVMLVALMSAIAAEAAASGRTANLVTLVVIAVVGFTATVAASRFIEHESEAA